MKHFYGILFKRVLDAKENYLNTKATYGYAHEWTQLEHAKFCALYQVVEDLNAEDLYQKWLAGDTADEQ